MILKKIIENNSIYQINHAIIDIEDLKKLLQLRITEVPIVKNFSLLGFIQRKTIVEHAFIKQNGFGVAIDDYILKPDVKIYLNDSIDKIEHKIKCTRFKILPIYTEENKYIGTIQLNEILKELIHEKDFIISQYETMFTGYETNK